MRETVFTNARIVLADEIVHGSLRVKDGLITDIAPSVATHSATSDVDCAGDYLIPGLVELHTDHLETHYRPRPGVYWDPIAALHAHDAQIAGSGITTVFDAVRIGSDTDTPDMLPHAQKLVEAVSACSAAGWTRAEHFLHLRCELPSHDVVRHFQTLAPNPLVRLISLMDHTPGQRQFRSLDDYKRFYEKYMGTTATTMQDYILARQADCARFSGPNRRQLVALAQAQNLAIASHDDATIAHVEEAVADGVRIAEFPTTLEAAAAAKDAGLANLMGAPNVVRGRSHTGNISATDLIEGGLLDILSSDYVPYAMLQAAFIIPTRLTQVSLPEALATVTRNPARAAGLDDRGEIALGKRADLVRLEAINNLPIVRGVWKQGERVS